MLDDSGDGWVHKNELREAVEMSLSRRLTEAEVADVMLGITRADEFNFQELLMAVKQSRDAVGTTLAAEAEFAFSFLGDNKPGVPQKITLDQLHKMITSMEGGLPTSELVPLMKEMPIDEDGFVDPATLVEWLDEKEQAVREAAARGDLSIMEINMLLEKLTEEEEYVAKMAGEAVAAPTFIKGRSVEMLEEKKRAEERAKTVDRDAILDVDDEEILQQQLVEAAEAAAKERERVRKEKGRFS
eukprot:PLAT3391.1.p1 GENE.PLAT3391.1~~PLAT3391.1.p1  ORF type:complete len:243 (+),score=91.58 PLAT3391.1:84-812(+)